MALGGGGFSDADDPRQPSAIDDLILDRARERRGRARPAVCFIGTASGDSAGYIERFHAAFDDSRRCPHLTLFDRRSTDIDGFLLDLDAIYVGGGNTASMLAVWRAHGVDAALRRAHDAGVVLAGISAGAICWFESGTTDSYGTQLAAVHGALGFVPGQPLPALRRRGSNGAPPTTGSSATATLPDGLAADDGAALVFDGPDLVESIAERDGAGTYRVALIDGAVVETTLPVRRLP